jgi:hypothetical protein
MGFFFEPRGIAVIGATPKSVGVVKNRSSSLREGGAEIGLRSMLDYILLQEGT